MALGLEIALVLRARGGANFLMQTQGIGAKDANEATREAAEILARYTENGGKVDLTGSGNSAPGFSAGQLLVCRGRLRVVYRLVSAIWVMTVAPANANVLLCYQLVDSNTKLLVAAAKGVDITPDKIARRYPEIYLAAGQILSTGVTAADASRLLAAAENEVAGIAPETGARLKGSNASIKSRLGVGSRKGLAPSASGLSMTSSASNDQSVSDGRPLAEEGEYMGAASFLLPEEALMQRAPGAAAAHVPRVPAAGLAHQPLDDLLAPANPVPGAEFLAGTGLETLEAPALGYDSKFANLRPPPPPPVSDNPWADFDTGVPVEPHRDAAEPFLAQPPAPPPKPSLPQPTAKQQRAIANGNALQLVELWKAHFVGPKLDMASTFGEVLGTGAVPRCAAEAAFQLTVPGSQSKVLSAFMKAVRGEKELTADAGRGVTVAKLSEAPAGEVPFMKYRLPAIAVPPVILMAVTLAERQKQTTFRQRQAASDATGAQHTGQLTDQPSTSVPAADSSSVATSATAMHAREPADATPAASPSAAAAAVHTQVANNAEQESAAHEQRLVVHLAVKADLPGPLRGVCVDLDVPSDLGDIIAADLGAQFAPQQRRVRWQLFDLQPGSKTVLRATIRAANEPQGGDDAACSKTLASLHAFGPPGWGLSGISLLSGALAGELKACRAAFHCEVFARPEVAKKRGDYAKRDMLDLGVQILESKKLKGLDGVTDAGRP